MHLPLNFQSKESMAMSDNQNYVPSFLDRSSAITAQPEDILDGAFWNTIMHPEDRQAIRAMEAIPALSTICRLIQDKALEKYARAQLIGDAIRLGPKQMPKLYRLLTDVCDAFRMKDIPEFYLRMDRHPNAYTQGEAHPLVTITSGLVEILSENDIRTVLAHECGHILFKHLRYTLAAKVIFAGADSTLGKWANLASFGALTGLEQCIYRWQRMAEYSADRSSLLFTGNITDAVRAQLLMAGGLRELPDDINIDEYVRQSEDFVRIFKPNNVEGWIANLTLISQDHPYTSSRCIELDSFSKRSEFKMAAQRLGTYRCPQCGGKMRSMTMCENGHFC